MKQFMMALAGTALATAALAQSTTTAPVRPVSPAVTTPGATMPPAAGMNTGTGTTTGAGVNTSTGMGTTTGAGVVSRNTGPAAAAGNSNQAVATTSANAPQPAHGKNSFSAGEARRRIEGQGFASVADLKKDNDGVWRGTGNKAGSKVGVWLDYKGNVGQQ